MVNLVFAAKFSGQTKIGHGEDDDNQQKHKNAQPNCRECLRSVIDIDREDPGVERGGQKEHDDSVDSSQALAAVVGCLIFDDAHTKGGFGDEEVIAAAGGDQQGEDDGNGMQFCFVVEMEK